MTQWPDDHSDHGRVYKWLKAATIEYRFRPGEQIVIGDLAERLRVSCTPVRETLIRLQAEELLDPAPRRGFFAKTLSLKEMIDLFRFRFLISKTSIEQAAGDFAEAVLDTAPSLTSGAGNPKEAASLVDTTDRKLHDDVTYAERIGEWVATLAGNDVLVRGIRNANNRTHYVRMIDFEDADRASGVRSTNALLLAALRRKDSSAAVAALQRNLDVQIDRLPAIIKEGISRAYTSPSWAEIPPRLDPPQTPSGMPIAGRAMNARR